MDRLSRVVTAVVVAMAVVVTVILVGDGTPASRLEEDREWVSQLREAEVTRAAGDSHVTTFHLRAAYRAALRTGRWEAMIEVGDAARRAGQGVAPAPRAIPTASRAYLAGLALARERRSVDGVLRVGEGFASLGDREMVEYCIGVAGRLAQRTGGEGALRVQAFVDRYRVASAASREGLRE